MMSEAGFDTARTEALASWPTGAQVDFQAAVAYHQRMPESKRFPIAMRQAVDNGCLLLQPRAGVALVDDHIRLLRYLETEGQADLLPTTIDAYTRQNRYQEASVGIAKSTTAGSSLLNGFPAVNHGVDGCRRVVEALSKPVQVRHGTPDARLLAEITLAAGFTSFEGGGISYNIPYAKKVPLERSLADWAYVDRLAGRYQAEGVTINREPFGPLTGTLLPPSIGNAVAIIEGLLALARGVKSLTLGYGQGGNLVQDTAALIALKKQAVEYFDAEGFSDYHLSTVFHQWMGGFPEDEAKAFAVICWGAVAAVNAGATKVIVKSPHEAMGIPTKEANAEGLKATRQIISMLRDQPPQVSAALDREIELIRTETANILDAVKRLGDGDWTSGTIAAFAAGVLDVPFAPSVFNKGRVLPVRDDEGYIRIYNPGHLPFDEAVLAYHRERLAARAKAEGRQVSFQMVTDDIYAISKGQLVGRPR